MRFFQSMMIEERFCKMKKALITGVYGQDGSYLSELLNDDGYEVHGICREKLSPNSAMIKQELVQKSISVVEHTDSLYDFESVHELIEQIRPDVVFHMAAIHRSSSGEGNNIIFAEKELFDKNVLATSNVLAACFSLIPSTRVVVAGSCLMYDATSGGVQDENTVFCSSSLYGLAKITENHLVEYYRKKGMFVCMPILYNHESHRRSEMFVTKKIALGLKSIKSGISKELVLGDLDVQKDWGYAGDYAAAMKLMSEAPNPVDYIISSGETHSIREYMEICAEMIGLEDWEKFIKVNSSILTRGNKSYLKGNPQKCMEELGWTRKLDFKGLISEIVNFY